MKILHRYILKDIFYYFLVFVAILIVLLLVYEIFDTREEFLERSPSLTDIVLFLLFSIPAQLAVTLPLIGWIASFFTYGIFTKNREILAMVASGVSFRSLALPALVFGILLGGFTFWFNEVVVPVSQTRARYLEQYKIQGRSEAKLTRRENLFVKGGGNRFYIMERYLTDQREMIFPTVLELSEDGSRIVDRIDAERARLTGDTAQDGSYLWEFTGVEHWTYTPEGQILTYERHEAPYEIQLEVALDRFLSRSKEPEEMNFAELKAYLDLLREKGGEEVQNYSISLHQKVSFPLAAMLMALLGFAVVVGVHIQRLARNFATGFVVVLGYYVLFALLKNLGEQEVVPPMAAAWMPVVVFALALLVLVRRLNRVPG